MKYAVEMGLSAMIYIPSFVKTGSGIQKLMAEGAYTYRHAPTHRHTQQGDLISVLLLYQNKESIQKTAFEADISRRSTHFYIRLTRIHEFNA
jgi:hypothetical protein